jgi:hypothetical protein
MDNLLAQGSAITLPGSSGAPVNIRYPAAFSGFSFGKLGDIVGRVIPFFFYAAGIGLLLMLISAGFTLMTSAGDAKKTSEAQQRMTYAVVGFLIIFVAYWGVQLAGHVLGLSEFGEMFR